MSRKYSVIFISFLIFWLIFVPKSAIIPDSTISGWITNFVSLFLMWYVRYDLIFIIKEKNRVFNLLLLTYLAVAIYSVYYNADTINRFELISITGETEKIPQGVTSIRHLLYYSIGLFASSLYIQRISRTKYIRTLVTTFIVLFLIILIPTYIEVLITPVEKEGDLTEYSVGNKFSIGYLHLYLCAFYCLIYPHLDNIIHKLVLLCFVFLMIITSIITECSTMIMGALIFMSLSVFTSDVLRKYLASAKIIVMSVLIFDIGFFFLVTWILQYDFVQYVIENVLNEDLTLTGRLQIYLDIQEAFAESPWIGLGYGNSIVIASYFTDAYDSQNGLVELFIQVGIIGVAVFLLLLYTASKIFENNDVCKYSFVAFVYTIIAISTIEIPFKHTFIFFLSFCFMQKRSYTLASLKQRIISKRLLKKFIRIIVYRKLRSQYE